MRKTTIAILCWFGATILTACMQPNKQAVYYNIDSLINEQAQLLSASHVRLSKQATVDNARHDTTLVPKDRTEWLNELNIFQDIDVMNRPVNRGGYRVETGLSDPSSNLTVDSFSALKDMPLVYLKTYYQGTPEKLKKLEAFYLQESTLMKSGRRFTMEFSDVHNKTMLTSYSITGVQKLLVGDTVRYTIQGVVEID